MNICDLAYLQLEKEMDINGMTVQEIRNNIEIIWDRYISIIETILKNIGNFAIK
jgi:hypothetical protein